MVGALPVVQLLGDELFKDRTGADSVWLPDAAPGPSLLGALRVGVHDGPADVCIGRPLAHPS